MTGRRSEARTHLCGISRIASVLAFGTPVALPRAPEAIGMMTWTEFGAYVSVAATVFAGGVGFCWVVLWRQ